MDQQIFKREKHIIIGIYLKIKLIQLLRVMVEAESEELCRKYVDQVVEIVRKKGHVAE